MDYQLHAAAGAIGSGLGYGTAFGVAYWREVESDWWEAQIYTAAWFPLGMLFGLAVGIALIQFRRHPVHRVAAAVVAGALAAGVAYVLARRWTAFQSDPFELVQFVDGALPGAALGLGVAVASARWRRLAATILLGILGLAAAFGYGDAAWEPTTILLAGLLLGGLTGAGFLFVDIGADTARSTASSIRKGATSWRPWHRIGRAPATHPPTPHER